MALAISRVTREMAVAISLCVRFPVHPIFLLFFPFLSWFHCKRLFKMKWLWNHFSVSISPSATWDSLSHVVSSASPNRSRVGPCLLPLFYTDRQNPVLETGRLDVSQALQVIRQYRFPAAHPQNSILRKFDLHRLTEMITNRLSKHDAQVVIRLLTNLCNLTSVETPLVWYFGTLINSTSCGKYHMIL